MDGAQSGEQAADMELMRRQAWAERINAVMGMNVTVHRADSVMASAPQEPVPEVTE